MDCVMAADLSDEINDLKKHIRRWHAELASLEGIRVEQARSGIDTVPISNRISGLKDTIRFREEELRELERRA